MAIAKPPRGCRVSICSYCHKSFIPRSQVKNPKACSERKCQKRRQRDNEKDWRSRNKGLYDHRYHAIQKRKRLEELKQKAQRILKALEVGGRFLGENLRFEVVERFFFQFLIELGVRQANKLWLI